MATVLVTGAAGGIGRVVVGRLVADGHSVRALDRVAHAGAPPEVGWRTGDVADPAVAREAVAGVDAVVHLAAIASPWHEPDEVTFANNVTSTFNVLHAAGRAGVARVVLASSVSIYGLAWAEREVDPPEIPLSETSELRIADPYALSKRTDEACAETVHRRFGVDVLCLRFPDVRGGAALATRGAQVRADPSVAHRELWAYLHVDDAAEAVARGLAAEVTGAVAINVVARGTLGDVDLADLARRWYPEVPCRIAPGDPDATGYTTERAERLLGFRAGHRWDEEAAAEDQRRGGRRT